MKTNRTLIAMCIATIFASGSLCAKDKWEYHTDGWEKTKSYGNVMVANDTAKQWGPWEDFVEPAAGAPSIAFIGAGAGDPYRIIPNPIPPEVGCAAGAWCGYMAVAVDDFKNYRYSKWDEYPQYDGGEGKRPYLNKFDPVNIALQFEQPEGGWYGMGGVNLTLTSDLIVSGDDLGAAAGTSTGMIPVKFGDKIWWWKIERQGLFEGMVWTEGGYIYVKSGFDDGNDNKYATMGLLKAKIQDYVGGDSSEGNDIYVYAPFVAGQVTSDMPGNVIAWYNGKAFLTQGDVCMKVDFGASKWWGTFNGGSGQTGFKVNGGDVLGAAFIAKTNNLTANDIGYKYSSISGSVNGSFYGPQAASAGGIVDITKTQNMPSNGGPALMLAPQQPTATRYVDVFLANKVFQTPNN